MNTLLPLVTVFGSLHYDITVHGPSRPRQGETVTGTSWRPKCGGKGGNQAVAAARAGVRAAMIGVVGDDDFGETLLANLDSKGVDRRFVRIASGCGSGMSVAIFDADGDYGAVIVSGANLTLSNMDLLAADELIYQTRILIVQNEVPEAANISAVRAVRAAGGRVMLNAAPARKLSNELMGLVDILVVNAIEAEVLGEVSVVDSLTKAIGAATILTGLCPAVVVTAGGAGVAFADREGHKITLAAKQVKVESTHGAGDQFVGALAAAIANGFAVETALDVANDAAAALVGTPESHRL